MPEEKVLQAMTIVFVLRGDGKVLLPRKTTKYCAGRRNGFGGKIEPGESPRQSAVRELEEESGLFTHPDSLVERARMEFHNCNQDGSYSIIQCHVYTTERWYGELSLGKEFEDPQWFPRNYLPVEDMAPGDRYWAQPALQNHCIRGVIKQDSFQRELLELPVIEYVSPGYFLEQVV